MDDTFFKPGKNFDDPIICNFNLGDKEIEAPYDDREKLYEELSSIFGIEAVEDITTENIDAIDVEIYTDTDININ